MRLNQGLLKNSTITIDADGPSLRILISSAGADTISLENCLRVNTAAEAWVKSFVVGSWKVEHKYSEFLRVLAIFRVAEPKALARGLMLPNVSHFFS